MLFMGRLEVFLRKYGKRLFPGYAILLFAFGLGLILLQRESLVAAFSAFHLVEILAIFGLCIGILMLGFPWSRLGYASFDRITQAGLIWLVGPAGSAVFNGVASLLFPFFLRGQTGQSVGDALLRGLHNVGMIVSVIMAGGWAFQLAGGQYPVDALEPGLILPVAATILAMQVTNGIGVRIRVALTDGRIRIPLDWFANSLETAAAFIGLLSAVIAVTTDDIVTWAYLLLLVGLMYSVKRLSDGSRQLEAKVRERTAHIEAQNRRLAQAQTRQKELLRELQRLSREDSLTGLHNRRHVDEYLRRESERIHRYGGELSIALLDLDHFKSVNDDFSHQVGDEVLRQVADLLRQEARSSDLVARYGGEEFLIALPSTSGDGALVVVERVRRAIEAHDWEAVVPGLTLTISGGVASIDEDGDLASLFKRCDDRLYAAKRVGRNRILAETDESD